ncbi:hypothetical protein [Kitasatospora brasiliensis]|uniref:hypothetical protein n=1 Tax=Kitasatospora brasiliensis TaxID=3058040 RepID=UPI00292D1B13|nr:hypothetical protein [Kitasatospora sp. K002]
MWVLRGAALAVLLVLLVGWNSSRSGGLVVLEQWLYHPVPLIAAAVALTVASLIVGMEFRTKLSQIGCAAGLMALVFGGLPIAGFAYIADQDRWSERRPGSGHPDRVLVVTDVAFSIDPVWRVELVSGTGWSARHWYLGTWDTENSDFVRVDWSGPEQITVTRQEGNTVFDVRPDGSLGEPREEARPPQR